MATGDEIAGLGLAIEVSNLGQCRVLHTIVGGSAHSCGKISPGDILIAVLDRERSPEFLPTEGLDFNEVRGLIAGRRGTKVTLKLQHQDSFGNNTDEIYLCEDLVRSPVQPPPLPPRPTVDAFNLFSPLDMARPSTAQGVNGMEGVGIVLDFKADSEHPSVSSLVPGRSAKTCGRIRIGDLLLSVDQKSTSSKTFEEIRAMIAGPVGTYVSLTFQGAEGIYECENLLRGIVKDSSPPELQAIPSALPELTAVRHNRQALGAFVAPNALSEQGKPASADAAPASSALPSSDLFGAREQRNGVKEAVEVGEAKAIADRRAADKAQLEAELAEKARKEAFESAKRAAEARILREAEEKQRREAEERQKRESDERQKREAEERRKRDAEERHKREVEVKTTQSHSIGEQADGTPASMTTPQAEPASEGRDGQWTSQLLLGAAVAVLAAFVVSRTLR